MPDAPGLTSIQFFNTWIPVHQRSLILVKALIESRIAGLADFPKAAPETDQPGVYELTIVRYPYKVYYEIAGEEVWIVHIRDARRRPWTEGEQ